MIVEHMPFISISINGSVEHVNLLGGWRQISTCRFLVSKRQNCGVGELCVVVENMPVISIPISGSVEQVKLLEGWTQILPYRLCV